MRNKILSYIIATGLSLLPAVSWSFTLPHNNPVPGGIAIVPLPVDSNAPPQVYYDDKRVMVAPDNDGSHRWVAVTGIPLGAKVGKQQLAIKTEHGNQMIPFEIKDKKYKTWIITD